ncbi:MAG: trypsin-like peptidase domain-containing protein, partial [Vicinamibacterales bacterium]
MRRRDACGNKRRRMNIPRFVSGTRMVRAGAVTIAVVALASGVWHNVVSAQGVRAPQVTFSPQTSPTPAPSRESTGFRTSYADLVKRVAPSVVTIRTERTGRVEPTALEGDELLRRFFGEDPGDTRRGRQPQPFAERALGSGVVVSRDGYILTNNHVVNGASTIDVEFSDGHSLKAKVVGLDEPSDLALLKVEAANLPVLAMGNSDAVQVGDVVLAIGNPLGIGQTVTMGIVSAKGRATGVGDGSYEDFLQTDAPINQGNSGGALVSMNGELVGINSQILSTSGGNIGIGFAIPSNMAGHVMAELRTEGRVRRARLGITVQPVTSEVAASLNLKDVGGAVVKDVAPQSAADRAGLKSGDVVLSFNGRSVTDANMLRNRIGESTPGSKATVGFSRAG